MSRSSRHLSSEENQALLDLLGEGKESMSTAVVQLLLGTRAHPCTWQKKITGVACFVKDTKRKGFFFEVQSKIFCNTS